MQFENKGYLCPIYLVVSFDGNILNRNYFFYGYVQYMNG